MELALEKGLMAERVKLGNGNKSPGYAFRAVTLKKVIVAAMCFMGVMMLGVVFSYRAAIQERYKLYMAQKNFASKVLQGDAESIAQTLQLEAALSIQSSTKEDVVRLLKRVRSFASKKIVEAKDLVSNDPHLVIQLGNVLHKIETFMDNERDTFLKDFEKEEEKRRSQIQALRKKQTEALEKLLIRVTDVRLEALEDMLGDLFDRVQNSLEVYLPERLWEPFEDFIDKLYQDDLNLAQGREEYEKKYKAHFGDPGLPAEMQHRIELAKDPGDLADVLDELYEGAQIFKGREALKKIHTQWLAAKHEAESVDPADEKASEASDAKYSKATVDAVIKVQELVNQGLIPQDFLDFDAMQLDIGEEDEEDFEISADTEK